MTATMFMVDIRPDLDVDLDLPVPCYRKGCEEPAIWQCVHRPCKHSHLYCTTHRKAAEWNERQYPGTIFIHGCCGETIDWTDWREI